jgi:hypothetical protein
MTAFSWQNQWYMKRVSGESAGTIRSHMDISSLVGHGIREIGWFSRISKLPLQIIQRLMQTTTLGQTQLSSWKKEMLSEMNKQKTRKARTYSTKAIIIYNSSSCSIIPCHLQWSLNYCIRNHWKLNIEIFRSHFYSSQKPWINHNFATDGIT